MAAESPSADDTNRYHLSFAWDGVTNADAYAVIVRYMGVETKRVWTSSTTVTVSNLSFDLDNYQFTAISSNIAGLSTNESPVAPTRWITVMDADSLSGPWTKLATNSFPPVAPQHFIALSNWSAAGLFKKD